MPELPDLAIYRDAIAARVIGQPITHVRIDNPFVLRTAVPSIADAEGKQVHDVRRLGKRLVLALDGDLFLVFHLMIAGRLRWFVDGGKPPKRITLARLEFPSGTLAFTEAGTKRRASIHLVHGERALAAMDPGGLEVLMADRDAFMARLQGENHTLKRALTDPRLFSGIGNAYSDEILHAARLSPLTLTSRIDDAAVERLYEAARAQLQLWTGRLRTRGAGLFPEKVTAFRPDMSVHGRFGLPCPVCGTKVQRIRYADNETNYCARCQTGGRLLADRALSRLLKQDWPRDIAALERDR
jgi:formamidopyrimidine-DNA glycosylase